MASVVDAQNALIRRLQTMPDRPAIAYPNGPRVTELPRIFVQVVTPSQRPFGMDGQTQVDAEINARIETEGDQLDTEANSILAAIQAHFRPSTRFDDVTIIEAPRPAGAYQSGGVYHIPVIIRGRTDF